VKTRYAAAVNGDTTLWAAGSTPWLRLLILRLQEGRCSRATPPRRRVGYCRDADVCPIRRSRAKGQGMALWKEGGAHRTKL